MFCLEAPLTRIGRGYYLSASIYPVGVKMVGGFLGKYAIHLLTQGLILCTTSTLVPDTPYVYIYKIPYILQLLP